MSVLNQSGEEQECPLCLEALEVDDLNFYPCTCGYQICRFCWNRIREMENGLCPACRKAYPENPADFTPLSQEQVVKIKTEKKAREQRRRNKTLESRRQLANVRVVQNNLVFVVGLPVRLADPEILKRQEYFGKYGKIHKVVINQSTTYAGSQGPSASAYVTYVSSADALKAIQSVNNVTVDGRVLKGSLGTTKYCANFMKNQPCPKTDCMYLHELGDPNASFSKEEMHLGMHQVYERKLHERSLAQQQALANSSGTSTNGEKNSSKEKNQQGFIPASMVTSSNINIVNSNSKLNKKDEPSSSGSPIEGKEAWPSLGSSPPETDSSENSKQHSPKPEEIGNGFDSTSQENFLSQDNESSESNSPTQCQSKHRDKKQSRDKSKTLDSNSATDHSDDELKTHEQTFETANNYDLDEIESDRHSLLDTHDLLDSNDHSLLDDDSHGLLGDNGSDALMMQRHREMLASLVDNGHHMHSKQIVDSFGLLDGYDRHMNRGLLDHKDLVREDRQNDTHSEHYMPLNAVDSATQLLGTNYPPGGMLTPFGVRLDGTVPGFAPPAAPAPPRDSFADQQEGRYFADNMDKFFTDFHKTQQLKIMLGKTQSPTVFGAGAGLKSPRLPQNMMHAHSLETQHKQRHQELLAAQNAAVSLSNTLNPSGINSINTTMNGIGSGINMGGGMNGIPSGLGIANMNSMGNIGISGMNNMNYNVMNSMNTGMSNIGTMNTLGAGINNMGAGINNMSAGMSNMGASINSMGAGINTMGATINAMSSGMSSMGSGMSSYGSATGASSNKRPTAVDDDLDFDPFKETQKAFAEMMESEMQQNGLSPRESAELMRRSRLPPPGFSHMNSFGLGAPPPQQQHQVDWTQMDPAIMSTSVNFPKPSPNPELFHRFSHMSLQGQMAAKPSYPPRQHNGLQAKLNWPPTFSQEPPYIPLPPGFTDLVQNAGAEIESK